MIAVVAGALWWWAVARLVWWPATAGPVESAVAAGGWGLSLLPVHCVPWAGRRRRAGDVVRPVWAVLSRGRAPGKRG
ncbi:hypothetical protein OG422_23450 [Streptomyces sp. NBC_01525]|uniref:hypothetical protein n=1 Tax=Streptomyces sp. NBC_01525 TaxID=2903893 RepID=UPI003864615E